jgi:ribonucleoside-diphosphate reductase alpha chain
VPKDATVEEIEQAYIESWKLGAKAISIYRDGSKRTQPLNTSKDKTKAAEARAPRRRAAPRARRRAPQAARRAHAITHKFDIAGHEGYITVGLFEDGSRARSSW